MEQAACDVLMHRAAAAKQILEVRCPHAAAEEDAIGKHLDRP